MKPEQEKPWLWKPGQSGNPAGRKTAGAYITEHLNSLAHADLSEADLRLIARDQKQPWTRRAAAERILRSLEAGDLADFEDYLEGTKKLPDLRKGGLNTEVVKRARVKVLKDGSVEREIELHDRAGGDFDRILDRTEGKAIARVEANVTSDMPIAEKAAAVRAALAGTGDATTAG